MLFTKTSKSEKRKSEPKDSVSKWSKIDAKVTIINAKGAIEVITIKEEKILAKGGFGNVIKLKDEQGNKFVKKTFTNNQIDYAKRLHIAEVLKKFGLLKGIEKETRNILMEYGGKSLLEVVKKRNQEYLKLIKAQQDTSNWKKTQREFMLDLFVSILKNLNIFVKNKMSHGDIKPGNILFSNKTKKFTIIDFDFVAYVKNGRAYEYVDENTLGLLSTIRGSDIFMAPEMLVKNQGTVQNFATDIYAAGQTVFVLLKQLSKDTDFSLETLLKKENAVKKGQVSIIGAYLWFYNTLTNFLAFEKDLAAEFTYFTFLMMQNADVRPKAEQLQDTWKKLDEFKLHFAVIISDEDTIELFSKTENSFDKKDDLGNTPLVYALHQGKMELYEKYLPYVKEAKNIVQLKLIEEHFYKDTFVTNKIR